MIYWVIVKNNPIKYTDPSGHGWFKKLRRKVKGFFKALTKPKTLFAIGAVVVASHFIGPAAGSFFAKAGLLTKGAAAVAGQAVAGAVGGAAAAAITGNSIGKGALVGAFSGAAYGTAAAFTKAGSLARIAAYGVAGGGTSKLAGGDFTSGALMASALQALKVGVSSIGKTFNIKKVWALRHRAFNSSNLEAHQRSAFEFGQYSGSPILAGATRSLVEVGQFFAYTAQDVFSRIAHGIPGEFQPYKFSNLNGGIFDSINDIKISIAGARAGRYAINPYLP